MREGWRPSNYEEIRKREGGSREGGGLNEETNLNKKVWRVLIPPRGKVCHASKAVTSFCMILKVLNKLIPKMVHVV